MSVESIVDEIKNMLRAAVPTPGHVGLIAGVQTPDIDLTYIPAGTIAYPSGTPAADEPNPDTPFRLASCTKPFAAALYGYASVMQGMVTAADTVQDYLPALGPLTALELSTLADYGSGLPADNEHNPGTAPTHWAYPYQVSDMTTFLDENAISINAMIGVQRAKPNIYAYSNLGFGLLTCAVQAALDFPTPQQLFEDVLFIPLGMTSSGLVPTGAVQLPLCYDNEGHSVTPPNTLLPAYYGAGGVYTSAADMVQWLTFSAGMRTTPLQPLVSFMWTRQRTDPAVAEGWFIRENLNPIWLVKNGGSPGASSWMGVCPDLPAIAFVMSNATALADRIGPKILSLLTGGNAQAPTDR